MRYITLWTARKEGRRDGRQGYPPQYYDGKEGRLSEFEKGVSITASAEINTAVEEWRRKENEILKELRTMVSEFKASIRRFNDALEAHRKRFGKDVAPEPRRRFGKGAIVLLVLLLIFEAGVNIFTFRFLREPGGTTVFLGTALAILIPWSGFYAGMIIKKRGRSLPEFAFASLFVAAAVALIFVVAQGRKIGIEVRNLNPRIVEETFLIFLFMNIIFFLIALWDGYTWGYSYPDLQKAYEELRRRKRQYMNRWARLREAFNHVLGYVRGKLGAANSLSLAYREANRRARGNVSEDQLPKYFNTDFMLPVKVPQEIQEYLTKDEPLYEYEQELGKREQAIKEQTELIANIDRIFEET